MCCAGLKYEISKLEEQLQRAQTAEQAVRADMAAVAERLASQAKAAGPSLEAAAAWLRFEKEANAARDVVNSRFPAQRRYEAKVVRSRRLAAQRGELQSEVAALEEQQLSGFQPVAWLQQKARDRALENARTNLEETNRELVAVTARLPQLEAAAADQVEPFEDAMDLCEAALSEKERDLEREVGVSRAEYERLRGRRQALEEAASAIRGA